MKRRDFIAGLGLTGYSVVVLADGIPPAQFSPATLEDMRRRMGVIAPAKGQALAALEKHMQVVDLEADVLVAGGGLAGVSAAISAARQGAKVVLVQDRSRLGGNSSSEVKMHVVGADGLATRVGWRESGL